MTDHKKRVSRAPFLVMILAAFVGLAMITEEPVRADEDWTCGTCSYDTDGGPFNSCNVVQANALAGCCGMGGGDAMCLSDGHNPYYNPGFWAYCHSSGKTCNCNKYGDSCKNYDTDYE